VLWATHLYGQPDGKQAGVLPMNKDSVPLTKFDEDEDRDDGK
jgi:hypothetical protein